MKGARSTAATVVALLCAFLVVARPDLASSQAAKTQATSSCGLPTTAPLWIDFADGSVPFSQDIFAHPGVIGAGSSQTLLPQLRAAGAATVYFDLYFKYRTGTLVSPLDTATVVTKANEIFDMAVMRTGCQTPSIAENEVFSANFPGPWSAASAQYKANILTYVRTLASRGAHPYLLVPSEPASDFAAAAWWRQLAAVSDIVVQVYPPANQIYAEGPIAGNRRLRNSIRRKLVNFTALGVPASRLGVMLGFQVAPGTGGREGLEPASSWFRVVKWQALAAKQVAKEIRIGSIWSWGWGTWSDATNDPDKKIAACVYLWTRKSSLCDALSMVGPDFNTSLRDGQVSLPAGARCKVGKWPLRNTQLVALTRIIGDRDAAFSALYARIIESDQVRVSPATVLEAERAIISRRFAGSRARYRRALAGAGASVLVARAIIGDELRRQSVTARLRVAKPSPSAIGDYYSDSESQLVRLVKVDPAPRWLGGRTRGYALAALAPTSLFRIKSGEEITLRTALGSYKVTALEPTTTLGNLPLSLVRNAIRNALIESARDDAFVKWTVVRQVSGLARTGCALDQMPLPGSVELNDYLPFLSLAGV